MWAAKNLQINYYIRKFILLTKCMFLFATKP